jgi:hypothetical protein
MAIIYSYPINTNILATDIIVGSSTVLVGGRPKNQTKSFEIQDLAAYFASAILPPGSYVPYTGAVGSVNLGAYNLTATSIIKAGGTNLQYLMADGSISTGTFVPAAALTKTDDTNVTLTLGGSPATALLAATSLTLGWNGTLADSRITSAAIWNAKQDAITLTTTGTSGAATLAGSTLNIPNYTLGLTGYVPYTGATQAVNLGAFDLTLNGATIGRGGGQVYSNIVFGLSSLLNNTTGQNNTYLGFSSGYYNTIGSYNSAIGCFASQFNTTGNYNISIGDTALYANTTGSNNIAVGPSALGSNTVGGSNTAIGKGALSFNTVGLQNIAIGNDAGKSLTISGNNTSGNQNIFIGESTTSLTNADANQIVIGYNAAGAGSNTVVIGNSSITTTRLRGAVQGGSFVKDTGTAAEYLMANGTVSTNGTLYSVVSTTYQIAAGALQSISSAIPSSIFASGNLLKLNAVITTTAASVAIATIEFYINSAATTVGATLIGRYNGPIGNQYIPIDRFFWVSGTTLYGRDFTASASTSTSNSAFAINSVLIPATQFYIIAQVTTTLTDRAAISSFKIEKS